MIQCRCNFSVTTTLFFVTILSNLLLISTLWEKNTNIDSQTCMVLHKSNWQLFDIRSGEFEGETSSRGVDFGTLRYCCASNGEILPSSRGYDPTLPSTSGGVPRSCRKGSFSVANDPSNCGDGNEDRRGRRLAATAPKRGNMKGNEMS